MSHEQGADFDPDQFSGQVRLFPLPNLVLFPHVVQPLHIFEPRYIDMFQEAIAGDRLPAMALLNPGWERDYEGRPSIAQVTCLAKVLTWQELPNGRFNLLAAGVGRVQIVKELPPDKTFREAHGVLLADEVDAAAQACAEMHRRLFLAFKKLLPDMDEAIESIGKTPVDASSLSMLCDVIGYAMDANVLAKQALLEERNVQRRAEKLLADLQAAAEEPRTKNQPIPFPPAFSAN